MNSIINYFIYPFTIFFTELILIYNYGQISNQKFILSKNNILKLLFMSILVYINNYYNLVSLRYLTAILITALSSKLIYKNNIKDSLFYSIILSILYIFLELLLSPLLMFKTSNIHIYNNTFYLKCIFSVIVGLIAILLLKMEKLIKFVNKIKFIIFESNINIIIITLFLVLVNIMIFFRVIDLKDKNILILIFTSLFFMFISIKIIINDKYNITILKDRNKNIKENFEAYSKTIDDCRELKHNLRNDLFAIKCSLSNEKQEEINQIINKYNNDYEWINKLNDIPDGLQGLIYLKQKEAEKKKIKFYINTSKNIKTNDKDYIDLCSVLGILLDNATDATSKTKEKILEINFKNDKDLNIEIINNYINNIDLNRIGRKNYSTKEYKSGLGLNYIKKINNQKIKVTFKIINNLFITNIKYIDKKTT